MIMKRNRILVNVVLFALMFSIATSSFAKTVSMDVEAAIKHLLENNRDFKKSEADLKKAGYNVRESASSAFPSVRLEGNLLKNGMIQTFEMPGGDSTMTEMQMTPDNIYRGTFVTEQLLFSGSAFGGYRVAQSYKKVADFAHKGNRNNLLQGFLVAYAQYMMLSDLVELQTENMELSKSHFDEAKLLNEIGAVDRFTLLRSEVEYLNSIPALREAEKNLQAAKSNLKLMLNLEKSVDLDLTPYEIKNEFRSDVTDIQNLARQQRPEIGAVENTAKAYKRAISVYRSTGWPTLSAYFNYNYEKFENSQASFGPSGEWNDNWVAGLSLNIPIFTGFNTWSKIQKGKVDYQKAAYDQSVLYDQIDLSVELAYDEYVRSSTDFDAWFRNVELAEEGLKIAELRWNNKGGSDLELRDTRLALKATKVNLSRAKFNLLKAKVDLLFAFGALDNIQF